MIILHVSDIHCASTTLRKLISEASYDLVAATGDFECLESAETLLSSPGDVVAVTGNMDNPSIRRRLSEAGVLVDGRQTVISGVRIAGVGGLDVASSIEMLSRNVDKVDLLLSHHPPRGILDVNLLGVHSGLDEVAWVSDKLGPRIHLFGHIHESPGSVISSGRLYVNPGPLLQGRYAIIDYTSLEARLLRVFE
ncbi:MAG: metallophosphoesterase family protein [Desulfurococcales archaeon]|nr:metallophosphoesterase family protein [Desulfurococcales archaeon]